MKNNYLLITGIPGTGKTTFSNYLQSKYGYRHIDLESEILLRVLFTSPKAYIKELKKQSSKVVCSWGFIPENDQINIVLLFKGLGFRLLWFDGDRIAARNAFVGRGTVPVDLLDLQMKRINNSNVIEKIKPDIINPFSKDKKFKTLKVIAKEILNEE